MTLLYAIGVGAVVNVVAAVVGRLLRLLGVRFDLSGEALVVGVAAALIVYSLGLDARRKLLRLALLGLAAHAALVINRFLGVAFTGRTPGEGGVEPFLFTPLALAFLFGALVIGSAIGLIIRGFQPRLPEWRPPERLVRAAGLAFVVATIVGLVWPAPFMAQAFGGTELVTAVTSLPLILAGPLAGGLYASRAGVHDAPDHRDAGGWHRRRRRPSRRSALRHRRGPAARHDRPVVVPRRAAPGGLANGCSDRAGLPHPGGLGAHGTRSLADTSIIL
jgi:hypothetical protein